MAAIKCNMTVEDYKLLSDAYHGEGGFVDGSYLVPHTREDTSSEGSYEKRKDCSYYQNYIQPVVDSHVNAVFSSEPSREYVDKNGYYEKFVLDADGNGNSLNRVMKEKSFTAKLKAITLIVVDNYDSIPDNAKDTVETRSLPYMFHVEPELLIYDECEVNDRRQLIKVVYYEDDVKIGDQTYKQKRVWDLNSTSLWRRNVVDNEFKWTMEEEKFHKLNYLPCFFFNSTPNLDDSKIPTSQFLHAARINKALFNIASEIREIQRQQTFSILTMPGNAPEDGLTLGTNNILYFPETGSHTPSFIAPPDGPAKILLEYTKELINEIYRMSCVSYTQQYANSQQSGESKRWTFHVTRQVLEDFAVNCEEAEKKIAIIFGKYINHDLQLKVNYSRKYGADDIDADIERTDIVLKMELPDAVKIEAIKKFVKSYFAEDEDETVQ
ncbi:MAG TPA: hypothetical protein VFM18_16250, partial [Methanosarcina sp.]|nr:hypothetical protein [Methanosarcina sp.]